MARDPVCGMDVDPSSAKGGQHVHGGTTYSFCIPGCREKFAKNPAAYLTPSDKPENPVPDPQTYTCPMHPEIRQIGPGSCPICGMALEPLTTTVEEAPSHELDDMTRRFWVSAVLTIPLAVLSMVQIGPL